MTTNDIFRLDNTEGYSDQQLAELNRRWRERHADVDPDSTEGKHLAEKLLEEIQAMPRQAVVRWAEQTGLRAVAVYAAKALRAVGLDSHADACAEANIETAVKLAAQAASAAIDAGAEAASDACYEAMDAAHGALCARENANYREHALQVAKSSLNAARYCGHSDSEEEAQQQALRLAAEEGGAL